MRLFFGIFLVVSSVLVGCSSSPVIQAEADTAFQNCLPKTRSRSAPTDTSKHNLNETDSRSGALYTPTPANIEALLCSPTNDQPIAATSLGSASGGRPTPRPLIDTTTQLTNVSNMPGADTDVAVALHPTQGWASVIWAHTPPDEPENGSVFVRVQDAATGMWRTGISVNTTPTYGFAGHPDVAVDPAGRIHVVFAQAYNGHKLYPYYSRSEDGGNTWSTPEPLPTPDWSNQSAGYSRIAVDPQGQLHIFFTVGTGQLDRYRYVEVQRPSVAAPGSAWRVESNIFGGDKEMRVALAFVPYGREAVRTVAVTGCNQGCGGVQPIVAIRDGLAGTWQRVAIPQASTLR